MPKVTASSSSSSSKKAQVVPTGHGKNKNVTTPPFIYKHCDLWDMLQTEHYERQHYTKICPVPTERDEASYHVLFQLFKALYPLEADNIHGHWYYYNKILIKYITKHGMMPKRWSHVYAHSISEEEFQQNVDSKVARMRSARRFSELRSKQLHDNVAKVAKEEGISEYDAWLSTVTERGNKFHEKVTLTFNHPSLMKMHVLAHTVTVEKSSIIGDVIQEIPFLKQLKSLYLVSSRLSGSKLTHIGYDYDLSKPFSAYPEVFPSCGVSVKTAGHLAYGQADKDIKWPLMYFNKGKVWPPENAVNWNDGDAINLAPFLVWNGWGNGPINVPAEEDNHWHNLVVIKYPNGVTKVVNYVAWRKMQKNGNIKDPLTNQPLDCAYMTEQLRLMLAEGVFEDRNNKPLPVVNLKFKK